MVIRRRKISNIRVAAVETLSAVRKALYRARASRRMLESLYSRSRDPSIAGLIEAHLKLESLLEAVALRLETIAFIGIVTKELVEAPFKVVREASTLRNVLPPDLANLISEIDEALTVIYESAAPAEYYGVAPEGYGDPSEEAKKILEEAETLARRRMEKLVAGEES
jgi:division protein CdvB (Snf7/Vps24/ESCRT-III family)